MINPEIGDSVRIIPMTLLIRKLFATLEAKGLLSAKERAALFLGVDSELRAFNLADARASLNYPMLAALADLAPR
jgi:hypothetical protein